MKKTAIKKENAAILKHRIGLITNKDYTNNNAKNTTNCKDRTDKQKGNSTDVAL